MNDWLKEVRGIKDDPYISCLGKKWQILLSTEPENTRSEEKLLGGWGGGGRWKN